MSDDPVPSIPALSWFKLARSNPAQYRRLAETNLADGNRVVVAGRGSVEESLLRGIIARACCDFNEIAEAETHARAALDGLPTAAPGLVRGELAALLANVLTLSDRVAEAVTVLDDAAKDADARASGILDVQRAAVEYRRGHMPAAFEASERAISAIGTDHPIERARALNNRGVIRLYLGNLATCGDDFAAAEQLYRGVGMTIAAAQTLHNSGMLAARLGDVPTALDRFERAERELDEHGYPVESQIVARAEVMVMAGLYHEVIDQLPEVVARLAAQGNHADAAEGQLYVAQAMLETGDRRTGDYAASAADLFVRSGRGGWGALLTDLAMEARAADGGHAVLDVDDAVRAAAALDAAGMQVFASASWLRAGLAAVRQGRVDDGLTMWATVASRRATALEQVFGFEAKARLAWHRGDRRGARNNIRAGLQLVDSLRQVMDATDLRVHTSRWGDRLADLAVEIAWSRGRAGEVLRAVERWRSTAVTAGRSRAASNDDVALLAELRSAQAAVAGALLDGTDPEGATRRYVTAQRAVTVSARRRSASADGATSPALRSDRREALGSAVAVSLVEHAGVLAAVVSTSKRHRLVPIGDAARVGRSGTAAVDALNRLAQVGNGAAAPLLAASVTAHLASLRSLVVSPLQPHLAAAEHLVLVPGPALFALPWHSLFGGAAPLTVAPSLRHWLDAGGGRRAGGTVTALAGPGLPGAVAEAEAVARVHPGARCLTGPDATVAALGRALDGAALAHVAAHATLHPVNPLFSAIEMSDGPATGYDLDTVKAAPAIVVLSACSSAVSTRRSGGEMLGLSTAFLGSSTASLVACSLRLPDGAAVGFFTRVHRELARGCDVAGAVSAAAAALDPSDPAALVTACAVNCYGRGDTTLAAVTPPARTTA